MTRARSRKCECVRGASTPARSSGHRGVELEWRRSLPTALITGITGQDGSYLAEFLLAKGYRVVGDRPPQLDDALRAHCPPGRSDRAGLGRSARPDLADRRGRRGCAPDEIYNLAAQSFVQTSWTQPVLTGEFTALGVTRILEAMRKAAPKARFYQASSSEMFGKVLETPQRETHPVLPAEPVRRCQGVRPLDHGELSREFRPVRGVGDTFQPREPSAEASSS